MRIAAAQVHQAWGRPDEGGALPLYTLSGDDPKNEIRIAYATDNRRHIPCQPAHQEFPEVYSRTPVHRSAFVAAYDILTRSPGRLQVGWGVSV